LTALSRMRAARISCWSVPKENLMNRRSIFTLATVTALALALLPSNLNSQQGTLKGQLVGTWTIVSWEDISPNGTKRQIANPKGFLIFDSGGRYAQVIARADRPKFKSPGEPTVEELAAATEDFFTANAGTWRVSEAEKLLIQVFEAALRPNDEGTLFRSGISLSGDELRLTSVRPLPTGARIDVLYQRTK
jgi:Lipocalin-like domain